MKSQPRTLLTSVQELTLTEMRDVEVCCGFGGTFCVKYPEISAHMASNKVTSIEATGADTLLAGDMGCLMNLAGRLKRLGSDLKVYHVAEVLAGRTDEAPPIGRRGAMRSTSVSFRQNSVEALLDPDLQKALGKMGFLGARQRAVDALPEWEQIRSTAREIKEHTLAHLDFYLQEFEANVEAQGGHVHWCSTPEEACTTVVLILRDSGARTVTKGKSMAGEEIGLNEALADATIDRLETDLGEYIIQLADEPPSHIIAPAIHKTKDQITELFHEHHQKHGKTEPVTDVGAIVNEAREVLRDGFRLMRVLPVTFWCRNWLNRPGDQRGQRRPHNMLPRVHIVTLAWRKSYQRSMT